MDHHEHEHEHYDGPSYDSSPSFEPYSGYAGYSSSSDIVSDYASDPSSPPTGPTGPSDTRRRGRRSTDHVEVDDKLDYSEVDKEHMEIIDDDGEIVESEARQQPAEEQ